ncbi:hypothetical protein PGN04_18905 [Klebsiella quasipneumoniae subsp. quasipneumoniae]|uniref:hypothetical protein n=1 Tax=Klebsiella quasipneumoniae TaxID=1463165 RepID=UPI0022F0111D|nr:hypothetical protein [Klebsiella quasipneumoniae]MDA5089948.1 hypothetical protein [Klebsiella quasipneumoniae subsp. quasipneumoniae]MDU4365742.1 hypothetical protein [Klebsiella oxytoca]HBS7136407.1 hypothetical protein [Klebsiella pneumoniae]
MSIRKNNVTVTISGPVGSGKSAIYAEIVITLTALGISVKHADPKPWQAEVNAGVYATAHDMLDMYKPIVTMREVLEK